MSFLPTSDSVIASFDTVPTDVSIPTTVDETDDARLQTIDTMGDYDPSQLSLPLMNDIWEKSKETEQEVTVIYVLHKLVIHRNVICRNETLHVPRVVESGFRYLERKNAKPIDSQLDFPVGSVEYFDNFNCGTRIFVCHSMIEEDVINYCVGLCKKCCAKQRYIYKDSMTLLYPPSDVLYYRKNGLDIPIEDVLE